MSHPKEEQTFVLVKPEGVRRGLIGEIISRFEGRGMKVIAMAMIDPSEEQIDGHYPQDEEWIKRLGEKTLKSYDKYGFNATEELGTDDPLEIGKMVRSWLVAHMSSTPLVKMVVKGPHAVDMVRKICGDTLPSEAELGTIRGDYSADSPAAANLEKRPIMNLVHASEDAEEAAHEIDHWFSPDELYDYQRVREALEGSQ